MSDRAERPVFLDALGDELARVARRERVRRRRTAPVRAAALAALAALALAAAAGATSGVGPFPELLHPGSAKPPSGPRFAPRAATGSFDPRLVRELSVLRRPRTAADAMGAAASYVAGDVAPASSLRIAAPPPPAGTHHATATTIPTWVVPATTGAASLAALSPGATGPGSGVAADPAMLAAGHAWMTTNDDLIGLAPDGVRSVTVTLHGGARVKLPVAGNVFGAHFDANVAGVQLNR